MINRYTSLLQFILIALFITPVTLFAQQTGSVSGTVTSGSGETLIGVNIVISGTTVGTATTIEGRYLLENVPAGQVTLVASYVGYKPEERTVTVRSGEETIVNFVLSRQFDMPGITLIGQQPERLARVPGSAAVITERQIAEIAPLSGQEVLRRIPGIHAVEQDGLGLRANIGVRGLDPSVSRSVLVLEDGIPVALAPYGEPEMYYTPSMDRMSGVEVVKGSGSILFGPQTFGGVINFITADPPPVPTASIHLRGGEGGFLTSRLSYGNTVGNTGVQVTYLRRQGDEVGLLDFGIHDLSTKLKLVLSDRSVVGIKLGLYDETSNSTYVGLSQAMFDSGNFDFTHLAPDDLLDIRRYSASVSHDFFLNENVTFRTTAYGYTTTRNWSRQDFDTVFNPDRDYARIVGDPSVEGGALFFRNSTGNRNRQFEVLGIEPRISVNYELGGIRNELDAGMRYLYERAFEQRVNGTINSPQSGLLRDDEIRTGHALSAFLQNRFNLTDAFSVTPGLRVEYFDYNRDIRRLGNEEQTTFRSDDLVAFIPGVGFNYQLREGIALYGGVHRGFGPPRVKDAISALGVSEELDAETSWNFEAGTRAQLIPGLFVELTGFYMNFTNQIIPVAEAAGGTGRPGASLTNGGETEHLGVETTLGLNLQQLFDTSWLIDLNTSATWIQAEFSSDRFVSSGGEQVNVKGNSVPYAPEWMVSSELRLAAPFGVGLTFVGTYIGKQYGDVLNREEGTLDGRGGAIPSYFVLDARASYQIPQLSNASVNVAVKNLLDERYIVSRRPQGIRVGMPRFFTAGIDLSF
ncbi:Fe(3+) dicitrate transport protein [Cyclonatronum proteinivorum]|uniref:Fe(3+) dicitrate transport protein n=1 Tax=Cyclonatronum proteinivorum TaxID=1457365 RepID=A0A345UG08_9BACT|nr:TonB-dependent receptor [Cyclonatronum proteinivorum]AXI99409.1 Fe(3+) dicitrate transport protein [Cyclonatronum proteinivorum]